MYFPDKYFTGLNKTQKVRRRREMTMRSKISWKEPNAYVRFKTDVGVKTRKSKYTLEWNKKYPKIHSLEGMSKETGVPMKYVRMVYNRGMAAWRTGHRPGATQQQWGYARVKSFLLKGKTYHTADSDLVREAKNGSSSAKKYWNSIHE